MMTGSDRNFNRKFISTPNLINGLRDKHLLDNATSLMVVFDDFGTFESFGKKTMNIRFLSMTAMKGDTVINTIDLKDVFDITGRINVWLNVGTQLNNVKLPYVMQLHSVVIDLNPSTFKRPSGDIVYHKIQYKELPDKEKTTAKYNKLKSNLSKKHVERVMSHVHDDYDLYID